MRRWRDDRGVALPMVILLGFVSSLLIATALMSASAGLRQAVTSQRSTSASDAAFAGVQDYLARVNSNPAYVRYGNLFAPFTVAAGSVATVSYPPTANPAMGTSAGLPGSSSWPGAVVPGSGGNAKFWYEIDNSTYTSTGIVRLRVTGLAGDRTRSYLVSLRVRGFFDFSYFTDLEMQDPQVSGDPSSCAVYYPRPSTCSAPIRFLPDDAVSGDVHSNDRMIICAATFTGQITTAYSGNPLYGTDGCTKTAPVNNIAHADVLPLPATNSSMRTDAACLYTGPTRITYTSDGYMTVVSPWTKYTSVSNGTGSQNPACGDITALHSVSGAKVLQLNHDALYVQNVPTSSSDPNYTSSTTTPALVSCTDVNGNTTTSANGPGWQMGSGSTMIRYPLSNEVPSTIRFNTPNSQWDTTLPAYGCRNGDLYMQGVVTTQTTAASENYVYAIGDITYADRANDVLGIVGQNGIIVWNPMQAYPSDSSNPYRPILTDTSREIDAAMLSVAHTFSVQNFDRGTARGLLKVYGSIGQKFRGPVSTSGDYDTGYDKSYSYDTLLKTVSPPKFLAAGSTQFTVTYYASIAAAFDQNGNPLS